MLSTIPCELPQEIASALVLMGELVHPAVALFPVSRGRPTSAGRWSGGQRRNGHGWRL